MGSSSKAAFSKMVYHQPSGDNSVGKLTRQNRFGLDVDVAKGGSRSGGAGVITGRWTLYYSRVHCELFHEVDAAQLGSWVCTTMADGG